MPLQQPTSLAEIYTKLNCNVNGRHGIATRFRVRDIKTLEDYAVLGVKDYGASGCKPSWFRGIWLDGWSRDCQLRGDYEQYVLLSSHDEIEMMWNMDFNLLSSYLTGSYREACLAAAEIQFGEG